MSAFNKAQFNLSRFNVESGGQVWLQGASNVTIGFSFEGLTFYAYGNSRVSFAKDTLQADRGRITRGSTAVAFAHESDVIGYINLKTDYSNVINTDCNISQIVSATGNTTENFESEVNLSQIANVKGTGTASYDIEQMNLSQIVWTSADAGEVFTATSDVMALTEFVCEFPELILRPGQTLVIDAASFNVLLDGDNAIYLHKGEWLTSMSRYSESIVISGTGDTRLTAEILYTERYL